ncbi:hypothetical protein HX799_01220 [Pseudomonas tolaasii]|uniref:hypothetical protein n=1 Tax=Pseudomonas tolaasii TaxID=29442 RepID=UPI0015BA0C6A|nr:hypothetical protein [Pseudomonas tolaasii]NWC49777.1 hypothetical protein [Pseudomonas tolaasii]NWE63709.1 hypothetical protein [Pseudomonas tolaasii]
MSIHAEEIARLTGSLVFDVKAGPLLAFEQMLKRAQASMVSVMRTADDLNKKLDRKLGVSANRDASSAANTAVEKSLAKQLATEGKLARLRQSQFRAQLAEQKLTSAGKREESFLQSAALKQQVAAAVLASKQHKAEQEALKVDLGRAKLQATAEQSKIREARLQDVLLRRQERTVQLVRQAALHQSKLQRAEAGLLAARERGVRLAERHQASKLASAAREARAAVRGEQAAGRYSMQQERFAAWKLRQERPESSGLGGLTVGLGAAGAALYALTEAAGYLGERIKQRQEVASDAQQFHNALDSSSEDPVIRAKFKKAFIETYQEFGQTINLETSRTYSNGVQGLMQKGYTPDEAIKVMRDRAALYRAGNLNTVQQESLNLQYGQVLAKGKAQGDDFKPIHVALGARLAGLVDIGAARYLGYKGKDEGASGFMLAKQKSGEITPRALDAGNAYAVDHSAEILKRHKSSLDAEQARVSNDQYLRDAGVNEDPKLVSALGERLEAERQLIASTTGLQAAFRDFDTALVQLQTGMLRMMAGKNADDSTKTAQQRAEEVGAAYTIEGSGIDTFALNGKSGSSRTVQQQLDADANDPVSKLWRLLGVGKDLQQVANDNRKRWDQVGFSDQAPWDIRPQALDTSGLNTRALPDFGKHLEDLLSQSDPNNAVAKVAAQAVATASRATPGSRGEMVSDDQSPKGGTTINNQTTVNAPPVEITVNVKTDANAAEIGAAVSGQVREEMQKTFQAYLPKETM